MAMMSARRIFVDTNILIYATNVDSPFHHMAMQALEITQDQGVVRTISTQILREFYGFATRINGQGQNFDRSRANDVLDKIEEFRASFEVLEDSSFVSVQLTELARYVEIGGRQIHDANIVATMLHYGIKHLLTNNPAHFMRFTKFISVVPL